MRALWHDNEKAITSITVSVLKSAKRKLEQVMMMNQKIHYVCKDMIL